MIIICKQLELQVTDFLVDEHILTSNSSNDFHIPI